VLAALASPVGGATPGASMEQAGDANPAVRTDRGVVVGKRAGAVDEFLGIPYAAPPVGDLRFRPPRPHTPWPAPRPATEYGSICPQRTAKGVTGDEDCLFLNVFAPVAGVASGRSGRLPVMVWIHGGGYNADSGSDTLYDPSAIVRAAGVVVVTLNYRLGILGFLAHPALSAEDRRGISGNYEIEDQQAALAWTRRNISAFGGDPARVTIFGESASVNSVLVNLASPTAAGLFRGAIAESPLYGVKPLPLDIAERMWGETVSAALGCPPDDDPGAAACLRAAAVKKLVMLGRNTRERPFGFVAPVIDGVVLMQPLREAFRSGAFNRAPIVIGSNHDEATPLGAVLYNLAVGPVRAGQYPRILAERFGARNGARVASAYPLARYLTPSQALAAYTAAFFACPIERVRAALASQVRTYGYEFTEPDPVATEGYPAKARGIELLDAHTFELPYVFGH
jgi:para-nitrobenzyl esterase